MAENTERRESVRIPMRFMVSTRDGGWEQLAGDLSINGVRLQDLSPYHFASLVTLRFQLPEEIQPRQVNVSIKRFFISGDHVHAAAVFDALDFDAEVAIARCIDAQNA